MVIPLDQQPFGLHSKKRLLQNYEWFGSQPHYPGPVKFALALCMYVYVQSMNRFCWKLVASLENNPFFTSLPTLPRIGYEIIHKPR